MSRSRLVVATAILALTATAAACGSESLPGAPATSGGVGTSVVPSTGAPLTTTSPPTTQPPATTEPPPSTTSVFMPGCSATGTPEPEPSDVPDEVAAVRDLIIRYAVTCDFDALAALAEEPSGAFTYSFGGGDDPAAFWRDAEENGDELLDILVQLLGMSHGTLDLPGDESGPLYFWPGAFGAEPTDEQWKEVAALYSAEEIASMKEFGGYIGYRVGITATGDWMFFVAGD